MAQHDYINKGPRTKKDKVPPKKAFPFLLVSLAVLLVSSFAFGLWYVKNHADPEQVKLAQNPQAQHSKTTEAKAKLPKAPDFIDEMKEHEIKVEVKEMEQGGPYQLICGSFKTYDQAEALKARIAFSGLASEVRRLDGKNGTWFRVRLGPYATKRLAESDKNRIKRANIMGCNVFDWS